jgi:transposase
MFLPPYSPQIQPAERLWPVTNEPIVNEYFETLAELDEVLAERCRILADDADQIRAHTSRIPSFPADASAWMKR